jgi:hypothetical protein
MRDDHYVTIINKEREQRLAKKVELMRGSPKKGNLVLEEWVKYYKRFVDQVGDKLINAGEKLREYASYRELEVS